jgi:hypothetical protein
MEYSRSKEVLSLVVDEAGGVEYTELWSGNVTTCGRLSEGRERDLADLWTTDAIGRVSRCGPGYVYGRSEDRRTCPESRNQWSYRRNVSFLPYVGIQYNAAGGAVSFLWDLESEVPEGLEMALTGTLGLLCAERRRLARSLRRGLPELAAKAGC